MSKMVAVEVYTYEELNEEAKENAFNKYHLADDYPYASDNANSLDAFENIFPVFIEEWEYDSCCGYIEWRFSEEDISEISGIRLLKYIVNNYWNDLFKGKAYYSKNYSKNTISKVIFNKDCILTGYYMDNIILQPIYDFLEHPNKNTTFRDLMEQCLDAWIESCKDGCAAYYTREVFEEQCEANEWEFYEDGTMF